MNEKVIDEFLETWSSMGSSWGISRSVARVHGLLIVTEQPWSLDEISERLRISRGNASMCLKELRSWGVIRKVEQPGERRERYSCEQDTWQMLFSIVRERKKREFDPALRGVREALKSAEERPAGIALDRLRSMAEMLATFDRLGERTLASEGRARMLISFLEGKI